MSLINNKDSILSQLSSNIIWIKDNINTIETKKVFKSNGKLENLIEKENIELEIIDIIDSDIHKTILSSIREKSKRIEVNYPKNKIEELFNISLKKALDIPKEYYIIVPVKFENLIKKRCQNKIIIDDNIFDYLIIGRDSRLIITDSIIDNKIKIKIDYSNFYTITLF
jgi:hypothetical protein